jgi:amino acid transporter
VLLTLYGVGTILGAGIYVLLGEVARLAGAALPFAFVIAGVIASVSALSYAELASRLPKSAGEAAYVAEAFGSAVLAQLTGWGVVLTGIVSAATLVRGFIGYLDVFVVWPSQVVIGVVVASLTALSAWGIAASMRAAGFVTLVEASGLVAVCWVARGSLAVPLERWLAIGSLPDFTAWAGVFAGAFVAFYAFIGFEDMVNVAEEVVEPERVIPVSIIVALLVSTLLYVVVATVASFALPLDVLSASRAPIAAIVAARGFSPSLIAAVGLFAVINGALIQLVMASRVLYGMGRQSLAWAYFGRVHPRRRTPVVAIGSGGAAIFLFASLLPLTALAQLTSFIALTVFAAINLALLVLKRSTASLPAFSVPLVVPMLGAAFSIGMLVMRLGTLLAQGAQ